MKKWSDLSVNEDESGKYTTTKIELDPVVIMVERKEAKKQKPVWTVAIYINNDTGFEVASSPLKIATERDKQGIPLDEQWETAKQNAKTFARKFFATMAKATEILLPTTTAR
jgi:hypothetical protein